jgi:hypothetical protein
MFILLKLPSLYDVCVLFESVTKVLFVFRNRIGWCARDALLKHDVSEWIALRVEEPLAPLGGVDFRGVQAPQGFVCVEFAVFDVRIAVFQSVMNFVNCSEAVRHPILARDRSMENLPALI